MTRQDYPITQAIRFLQGKKIGFKPHLYSYEEHGGTHHAANVLNIQEHSAIKTLVMETDEFHAFIILMHLKILTLGWLIIVSILFSFSASYGAGLILTWDQSTKKELAGYYVHYGTSPQTYFKKPLRVLKEGLVEVDGKVSYEFPAPLTPGVTYYFAVTGYDIQCLEIVYSNEVQYTVPQ